MAGLEFYKKCIFSVLSDCFSKYDFYFDAFFYGLQEECGCGFKDTFLDVHAGEQFDGLKLVDGVLIEFFDGL